jgi:hypothetical protein
MEVSGQLCNQGKGSPIWTAKEAGWVPELIKTLWQREKLLSLHGINP